MKKVLWVIGAVLAVCGVAAAVYLFIASKKGKSIFRCRKTSADEASECENIEDVVRENANGSTESEIDELVAELEDMMNEA